MIINGNYHYDTGHQHKNCRQTRRKVGKRYQVILFMGSKRPAFFSDSVAWYQQNLCGTGMVSSIVILLCCQTL